MKYLALAIVLLVAALLTDCTCAKPEWRSGVVSDKIIHPPWVEVHSDKNHTWTEYHGPDYFVCVEVSGNVGRIHVSSWVYDQWRVGQPCEVQFRKGRIMTYGYLWLRKPDW